MENNNILPKVATASDDQGNINNKESVLDLAYHAKKQELESNKYGIEVPESIEKCHTPKQVLAFANKHYNIPLPIMVANDQEDFTNELTKVRHLINKKVEEKFAESQKPVSNEVVILQSRVKELEEEKTTFAKENNFAFLKLTASKNLKVKDNLMDAVVAESLRNLSSQGIDLSTATPEQLFQSAESAVQVYPWSVQINPNGSFTQTNINNKIIQTESIFERALGKR